jgi:hypothetical protein
LAWVTIDSKSGYIDNTGRYIWSPKNWFIELTWSITIGYSWVLVWTLTKYIYIM